MSILVIATVHLSAWLTVPLGGCVIACLLWYWLMLGGEGVPETRRRIRRASLIAMLVGVIVIVRALSFIDPATDPSNYTVAWAMSIVLVLVIILLAFIDMTNNLRVHHRHTQEAMNRTREQLTQAVLDRQGNADDLPK